MLNETTLPSPFDCVEGFTLARSGVRGRLVRLEGAINSIVTRHAYPKAVAAVLAEAAVLAIALAYALKQDGSFSLQTKADGPVNMLVADITHQGHLRAYAQYDSQKVARAGVGSALLLGKGHLAFTIDPGNGQDRHQGIVEIIGRDMASVVEHYFHQSEQIKTHFEVFVRQNAEGIWQAAAVMLQRLPEQGGYAANSNLIGGEPAEEASAEDWRRAVLLLQTLGEAEIFDQTLSNATLLHRLFHEEGLQGEASHPITDHCRCSRQRVAMVLSTLTPEELAAMRVNKIVEVTCEFCSTRYDFSESQLTNLLPGPGVG